MDHRRWVVGGVVGLVTILAARARPAAACQPPQFHGNTVPDERTILPTNLTEIWVEWAGSSGTDTFALEGPDRTLLLTGDMRQGPYTRFPLPEPLQPEAVYRLVFDESPRHEVAWVTSTEADTTAPGAVNISSPSAGVRELHYDHSCVDGTEGYQEDERAVVAFVSEAAPVAGVDVASVVATLTARGSPMCTVRSPPGELYFGLRFCPARSLTFGPNDTVCVEVVPYDLAGNAGPVSTACTVARACRPSEDVGDGGPVNECELEGCQATRSAGPWLTLLVLLAGWARRRRR